MPGAVCGCAFAAIIRSTASPSRIVALTGRDAPVWDAIDPIEFLARERDVHCVDVFLQPHRAARAGNWNDVVLREQPGERKLRGRAALRGSLAEETIGPLRPIVRYCIAVLPRQIVLIMKSHLAARMPNEIVGPMRT